MPCWHAHAIEAPEDTVVLRVSDEPLMTKVGLLRTADT
jgi:gentisate 1,2-dioxygenase